MKDYRVSYARREFASRGRNAWKAKGARGRTTQSRLRTKFRRLGIPQGEKGKEIGRKVKCCPALLHTLSLPGAQSAPVRKGSGRAGGSTGTQSVPPEDLLGPPPAPSAFPVFVSICLMVEYLCLVS